MAKKRHLANAPITEAIIDFKAKLPLDFKVEQFSILKEKLSDRYPILEGHKEIQTGMEIKDGIQVAQFTKDMGLQGFFFKSADKCNVAQFRVNGFTFNRLKPYTSWDEVFKEASELWGIYVETASPELITRIAVRYINHLKLPLPMTEISQYLTAPPPIPDDIPKNVISFLTRVVVDDPKLGLMANIIQVLEKSVDPHYAMVIIDIDVYKQDEFKIDDEQIWSIFKKLRNMKNTIFFNSITEDAAELFE